jgi:hypothetical protein
MSIESYSFCGDTYGSYWGTISDEELTRKNAEASLKIRSLFDAGVPFYTKEDIRNICQQLEELSEKGQKVSVRGVDGVMVDFEIKTGLTFEAHKPDLEFVVCVDRCPHFSTTLLSIPVPTTNKVTGERRS